MLHYQEGYKLGYLDGEFAQNMCLVMRLRDTFALTDT
jgi:hypothetical protein